MHNPDHTLIQHPARIAALRDLLLLDSGPEAAFDRLTRLATTITKSPVALVTLVDADREYFKSQVGLSGQWATRREAPLTQTFCPQVVATGEMLSIEDSRFHPLGEDSPALREMNIIAYLGLPLTLKSGHTIGSFCVIDDKPRHWSDQDLAFMGDLAALTLTEIELRSGSKHGQAVTPWDEIIETTPDLIWLADMDNHVRGLNRAARRFFDISEAEAADLRVGSFLHTEAFHYLRNEALRTADESGAWSGELYLVRHDERLVPFTVVVLVQHDKSGRPDSWCAIARDITALRETENSLQKTLEEEQRLTRLQGRFINTVSHEFRTPLSTVLSSLELLIRHGARSDPATHYERMKKGVRDISTILDRGIKLLNDAEDETLPFITEISLETFAREITTSATQGFEGRVIQVELPQNTIIARMDVASLRSVAEHLLSNALKFSTTGAMVALKFALRDCDDPAEQCHLVMYVRDRGIGIPEDDQPFIFERFYRAYDQPNVPGIGAGLYHVKRLVERLDGRIEFYSRLGEGTEFVIIVPVEIVSSEPLEPHPKRGGSNAPASPSE